MGRWTRDVTIDWRGAVKHGRIEIGVPIRASSQGWTCMVFVSEILVNAVPASGVDEIDALASAMRYLRRLIAAHKQDGIRVWWLDEGDDACL